MSRSVRSAPIVNAGPWVARGRDGLNPRSARQQAARWTRWTGLVVVLSGVSAASITILALHGSGPADHASQTGLTTGVLASLSVTATVTYLAILAVLHALPTGYSPVRNAVSDYGVGRSRPLFTVGLYVSSVGVLALAVALLTGVGAPPLATRDVAYLALIPLARIAMIIFPTTLEGQRITRTGLLHYACAIAAFTLTYLAISDLTPALRALQPRDWARAPLGWTAWIVAPALALVVITMLRPLRRIFGLFERIFLLTTNIWFALAAAALVTRLN